MTEDNVRKMWSDAELDAALHDLHREAGSEDGLASARAALLAAASGAPAGRRMEGPPAKKRGGSWRWIAVAAAVTALTGGLVVAKEIGLPGPTDIGGPVGTTDQSPVLKGSDVPLPSDGYRHSVRSGWVLLFSADGKSSAYVEEREDRWIPADPKGDWWMSRTQTDNVRWRTGQSNKPALTIPPPGSNNRIAKGGRFGPDIAKPFPNPTTTTNKQIPPVSSPHSTTTTAPPLPLLAGWNNPDADFITSLPADSATLRKMLAIPDSGSTADPTPESALYRVLGVLEIGLANAAQRVALCQALAMVNGVTVRENMEGPGGTHGLGFEVNNVEHLVIVIDPSTAQLLSSTETSRRKSGPTAPDVNTRESTYTFSISPGPGV